MGKDVVLDILGYLALHGGVLLNKNFTEKDLTNSLSVKNRDELTGYLMGLMETVDSNQSEYVFKERYVYTFLPSIFGLMNLATENI